MINLGDTVSVSRIFTERDVIHFSALSDDKNPIHLDAGYAEQSIFAGRIVHGILVASLFSGLIGMRLPGKGSIYLAQNLTFKKPIYLDEEITASVEILSLRRDKQIAELRTVCRNGEGLIAVDGDAVVKYPARLESQS